VVYGCYHERVVVPHPRRSFSAARKGCLSLKIEISTSKRGGTLPVISISTVADMLENIDKDNIINASVKAISNGKREKATRLLNALTEKNIELNSEQNDKKMSAICDFFTEIDLGDGLEISDE
jgi:hypothetical protein